MEDNEHELRRPDIHTELQRYIRTRRLGWDTDYDVRPVWEDGTPAHTIKRFGIVNRYDLTREFPVITLRRTAFKSAVDELLWIWQKNPTISMT